MGMLNTPLNMRFIHQGGFYLLTFMDWYGYLFGPFIIGLCHCVAVGWIYGTFKQVQILIEKLRTVSYRRIVVQDIHDIQDILDIHILFKISTYC